VLKRDEMRVIAYGTGMPIPRLKQAAACFLVELGNGEKFIWSIIIGRAGSKGSRGKLCNEIEPAERQGGRGYSPEL